MTSKKTIQHDPNAVKPVKATRDARASSYEDFRLPFDGRKWATVAMQRRALYIELSSYANGDGTGACPSIESLQRCAGSRRTTLRRLKELKLLGRIEDRGKSRYQGTTYRAILIPVESQDAENEMTVADLLRLRDRRAQQQRDGLLLPNGYQLWEAQSRSMYPEQWKIIDEGAPMVPDSPQKTAEGFSNQSHTSIVPDSREVSPMVPDKTSIVPDSTPMVPRTLAHDRPIIPTNHTDQQTHSPKSAKLQIEIASEPDSKPEEKKIPTTLRGEIQKPTPIEQPKPNPLPETYRTPEHPCRYCGEIVSDRDFALDVHMCNERATSLLREKETVADRRKRGIR